jgi:hypothetical protein
MDSEIREESKIESTTAISFLGSSTLTIPECDIRRGSDFLARGIVTCGACSTDNSLAQGLSPAIPPKRIRVSKEMSAFSSIHIVIFSPMNDVEM